MKKRIIYVLTFIVVFTILAFQIVNIFNLKTATFKEVVQDRLNTQGVTSMKIVKQSKEADEGDITITDEKKINEIIGAFSEVKLKKAVIAGIDYTNSYLMIIKTKKEKDFNILFYDTGYMNIYENDPDTTGNEPKSYKLTGEYNAETIKQYFNR